MGGCCPPPAPSQAPPKALGPKPELLCFYAVGASGARSPRWFYRAAVPPDNTTSGVRAQKPLQCKNTAKLPQEAPKTKSRRLGTAPLRPKILCFHVGTASGPGAQAGLLRWGAAAPHPLPPSLLPKPTTLGPKPKLLCFYAVGPSFWRAKSEVVLLGGGGSGPHPSRPTHHPTSPRGFGHQQPPNALPTAEGVSHKVSARIESLR